MSLPDAMEEDGAGFPVPTAAHEADISQSATAFEAATAPPTAAADALDVDGDPASTAAVPALSSTETPPPQVQPQPVSPSAAASAAAATAATAAATTQPPPTVAGASPSSLPPRTSTPMRNTGPSGNAESSSRAASQHPPDAGFAVPAEATPHGAPARQYLNTKVTGVLLEGMKMVAKEQPKDPLRVLGEFLLQRSKDLEQPTV